MTEHKRRGPKKTLTEWIRCAATPEDKAALVRIHQHYYGGLKDYNESDVIRLAIRSEAARLTSTAGHPAQAS
jgi:hypothetical protein